MTTSPMARLLHVIQGVCPGFAPSHVGLPFEQLAIDSFDLVMIRTSFEEQLGARVPDSVWTSARSFQDLQAHLEGARANQAAPARESPVDHARDVVVNMPQMAVGGLSESWLFKELGDVHWRTLCAALQRPSHDIRDAAGDRLYATFTRIRIEATPHLKAFVENDTLAFRVRLSRFGSGLYFSECDVAGGSGSLKASLMSSFTKREDGNTSLLKSEPVLPVDFDCASLGEMPPFGLEYQATRRSRPREGAVALFEADYRLNPYHDINGVNLLYFAAYPVIHDVLERELIHADRRRWNLTEVHQDWALAASTRVKDVFYYGNCDIDDTVLFRVDECRQPAASQIIEVRSSLFRKSDGRKLADIVSVKVHHG